MSFSNETGFEVAAAIMAMPRARIKPMDRIGIAYATSHDDLHLLPSRRERGRQQSVEDGGAEITLRRSPPARCEDVPAKRQRRLPQRPEGSRGPEAPHRRRHSQEMGCR